MAANAGSHGPTPGPSATVAHHRDMLDEVECRIIGMVRAGVEPEAIATLFGNLSHRDLALVCCQMAKRLSRNGETKNQNPAIALVKTNESESSSGSLPVPICDSSIEQARIPDVQPRKSRSFVVGHQQESIFEALSKFSSADVDAVAGSGKTTTLVEGSRRALAARFDASIRMFAYNRAVAQELKTRLPSGAQATTLHGFVFQALSRQHGKITPNESRITDAAYKLVQQSQVSGRDRSAAQRDLRGLWSLALATCTPVDDADLLRSMAVEYGIAVDAESPVVSMVKDLDAFLRKQPGTSFDEMLRTYLEGDYKASFINMLLVDEAQDLNRMMIEIIAKIAPQSVVAVGDRRQAIYAFRGANSRAMDLLGERFGITAHLPLTTTFRCAKAIVRAAQKLVPSIQALEDAPAGVVDERPRKMLFPTIAVTEPGDLVLCRTNAPLIGAMLRRRSINAAPVRVVGEDSAKSLIRAIERASKDRKWDTKELAMTMLADASVRSKQLKANGQAFAAETVIDEASTAAKFLCESETVADACSLIQGLFVSAPDPACINFSSIHRAKGLEANRVVLLGHNLIPNPLVMASKSTILIEQETNLLYVAYTRARQVLILQEMDAKDL